MSEIEKLLNTMGALAVTAKRLPKAAYLGASAFEKLKSMSSDIRLAPLVGVPVFVVPELEPDAAYLEYADGRVESLLEEPKR